MHEAGDPEATRHPTAGLPSAARSRYTAAVHEERLSFDVSGRAGRVSAIVVRPEPARAALLLAHGAGAGMEHPFMSTLAAALAERGIASLRYQFPYIEAGRRRPDPPALLEATVRAAIPVAAGVLGGLPLFAGGKSMGGRMTSRAAAGAPLPGVRGLVFFGFPLHAAGAPDTARADHLHAVELPMLFLQGDRDRLAALELLRPICARLGSRARLHVVRGADHGFSVLARSGRSNEEGRAELADTTAAWISELSR